jgi:hypothetical protein
LIAPLALLLLPLGAVPQPSASGRAGAEPTPLRGADLDLLRDVRAVAQRVSALRGQVFDREPVAVRAGPDARRAAAEGRIARSLPPERLAARGRSWADMGLGDPRTPFSLWLHLASDLEGVSFDPSGPRLLVDPDRLTPRDFISTPEDGPPSQLLQATGIRPDEPLVAHVLIHLRQYERSAADLAEPTTDRLLARAAWAEGEANLLAIRYLFDPMGLADVVLDSGIGPEEVLGGGLLPEAAGNASEVERRLLGFAFGEGFAQAVEAYRAGGWSGLERAAATRSTTRDVLHPGAAEPGERPIPDPQLPLPAGYRLVDRDSLGEEAVVVLISILTGKDDLGLQAGEGWDGDAAFRWERPGAEALGVTLWVTRWTDETGAADFDYAYRRALQARFPRTELATVGEGRRRLDADDRVVRLDRMPREVWIRVAPAALDPHLERPPARGRGPGRPGA